MKNTTISSALSIISFIILPISFLSSLFLGRIINDIIDNADEIVEGKWKGQEGPILFYRKGEDLVLIRKNDDNFVSIFKGGANNGWFKDLGR